MQLTATVTAKLDVRVSIPISKGVAGWNSDDLAWNLAVARLKKEALKAIVSEDDLLDWDITDIEEDK